MLLFLWSFKVLLAHRTVCDKLSMSIMLTIFDVSIEEKRVARRWVGLQTLLWFRLKDLSIDEMVGA